LRYKAPDSSEKESGGTTIDSIGLQIIDPNGAITREVEFVDTGEQRDGDYYYVRVTQIDGGRACSTMARADDGRVTRVGRVLRAMGLDELPQILNILKGDMSFVGPRALAIDEVLHSGTAARYEDLPGFTERLSVRPGLTSLATIFIPKDTDPRRKLRYDLVYVRKLSLKLDLYLIALSYWISITGGWEKRDGKILGGN
jgi:lipopolysaccharide/colanic/teichoic acid biosynthesis glycosyltransferase